MLNRPLLAFTLAFLASSCTEEPTPLQNLTDQSAIKPATATAAGPMAVISDARTNGSPGFYFLFPVVLEKTPKNDPFDAGARPTVSICRFVNGACAETVAEFPYADGPGLALSTTRQRSPFESYNATWVTPKTKAGEKYRATVKAYGLELGFADIQLVRGLHDLRSVPDQVVGIVAGWPLPIPFRIDILRKLVVLEQPTLERDGVAFTSPLVVSIQSDRGAQLNANIPVTVSVAGTGSTLQGVTTVHASEGRAVFSDLQIGGAGFVRLRVEAPAARPVITDSIRIAPERLSIDPTTLRLTDDIAGQARGVYTFEILQTPPALRPGMVLVGTEGAGFIRRVVQALNTGGHLVVTTTEGTIADLGIVGTFTASPFASNPSIGNTTTGSARVSGGPLAAPPLTISVPIGPCGVAQVGISVTPGFGVNATTLTTNKWGVPVSFHTQLVADLAIDGQYDVPLCPAPGTFGFSIPLAPTVSIPIAPIVPGLLTLSLKFSVGANLSARSTISTSFKAAYTYTPRLSVDITCDFSSPILPCTAAPTTTFSVSAGPIQIARPQPGTFDVTQGVGIGVGLGLDILLAGSVGFQVVRGPYVGWKAADNPSQSRLDLTCESGESTSGRIFGGIFGFNGTYQLFSIKKANPPFCLQSFPYSGFIGGVVASPQRGPLSGITVTAGGQSATTDGTGSYFLAGVPVGAAVARVVGLPSGCTDPGPQTTTVNANSLTTLNITVTCAPVTGSIQGTITSPQIGPLAGVVVSAGGQSTATSSGGNYTLGNVPTGATSVALGNLPASCVNPGSKAVTVSAGLSMTVDFTVTCAAPTGTVTGTVSSLQLGSLVGVRVSAAGLTSVTNATGAYALAKVPAGQTTVSLAGLPTNCADPGGQRVLVVANQSVTVNFSVQCTPSAVGADAHYPLDGNYVDILAGQNGTPFGNPQFAIDRFGAAGRALHFDGLDDSVSVPAPVTNGLSAGTVTFWLKLDDAVEPYNLFAKSIAPLGSQNPYPFRAQFGSPGLGVPIDRWYFQVQNEIMSGTGSGYTPPGAYGVTSWHKYTFTWSSTTKRIYQDDRRVAEFTGSFSPLPSLGELVFSPRSQARVEMLRGVVDDIRVYRRQLTDQEVASEYSAEAPTGPIVNLDTNQHFLNRGETSVLVWSATNATSCSASWAASTAASGSQAVTPVVTTTYTMTCTGPGGTASASTTVTVVTPLPAGLVAFYPLDSDGADRSGNGNNGILSAGVVPAVGRAGPGTALDFSGAGVVTVSSNPAIKALTTDLTIVAWVRRGSSAITSGMIPVSRRNGIPIHFELYSMPEGFGFQCCSTTANVTGLFYHPTGNGLAVLNDGQWHQVAVTRRFGIGGFTQLYLDGLLVPGNYTSGSADDPAPVLDADLLIGRQLSASPGQFNGALDNVYIFNRVLSASEIQALP